MTILQISPIAPEAKPGYAIPAKWDTREFEIHVSNDTTVEQAREIVEARGYQIHSLLECEGYSMAQYATRKNPTRLGPPQCEGPKHRKICIEVEAKIAADYVEPRNETLTND